MNWVSKLSGAIFALMLISFIVPDLQAGDGLFARLRNRNCKTQCVPQATCQSSCVPQPTCFSQCLQQPTCYSPCVPQPTCTNPCVQGCNQNYCNFVKTCEKLRCRYPDHYARCMSIALSQKCRCLNGCNSNGAVRMLAIGQDEYLCVIPLNPDPQQCMDMYDKCMENKRLRRLAGDATPDECADCYHACIDACFTMTLP